MRVVLALGILLLGGPAGGEGGYTIKDLEILESQGNYPDFFLHAKDIRPALRSEYWKKMVRHMAVGWLDYKLKRNIFDAESFERIEKIAGWPTLQRDHFFQLKRGEYAVRMLESCFSGRKEEHPSCLKRMEQFWVRSDKIPATGYRLAGLLARHKRSGGWRYLSDILIKEEAAVYCEQQSVQDEFLKVVEDWNVSDGIAAWIDKMIHPSCWKSMAEGLKNVLWKRGHTVEEKVFKILVAKGALGEEDKDFYYALFILNDPRVGKTFNLAWNRMKELGENFSRRQKVLQRLIKLDPLPDAVVGTSEMSKRKTLLDFFSRHFPEYFNHYGKVCLNYLEGKGSFPQGNPTVRCRDFFRDTDSLVSDKLYLRYSALKKKGLVVD